MFSWLTRLWYHFVIFVKLLLTSWASDDISPCILWETSQTDWHICIFTFLAVSPTCLACRHPHWLRVCNTFSYSQHCSMSSPTFVGCWLRSGLVPSAHIFTSVAFPPRVLQAGLLLLNTINLLLSAKFPPDGTFCCVRQTCPPFLSPTLHLSK